VPYRHQFNFTLTGLTESASAVERLRAIYARLATGSFPTGMNAELQATTTAAEATFLAALNDDLNTAEARAAIFDLVRVANTAIDAGTLQAENAAQVLAILQKFDTIFDVLTDRDADITRSALAWAEMEGLTSEVSNETAAQFALTDADIEAKIAARTEAKKRKDFKGADAIREELAALGIVLEDSKDGVRWKRK
jgi:cysteinyl-tRNA synthetase